MSEDNPYDSISLLIQNSMETLFRATLLLRVVGRLAPQAEHHEAVAVAFDHMIANLQAGMLDAHRLKEGVPISLITPPVDAEEEATVQTYLCIGCHQAVEACFYNPATGRARCILCVVDPPEFDNFSDGRHAVSG